MVSLVGGPVQDFLGVKCVTMEPTLNENYRAVKAHTYEWEHEGRPFIAMEFLEGQTLKHVIDVGAGLAPPGSGAGRAPRGLPLQALLDLAIRIADGLHTAHPKGITIATSSRRTFS